VALKNTATDYGSLAKWLHWLIAAGMLVVLGLGLLQAEMERGPQKSELRVIHGSIALTLLLLMTARIIWRWANTVPAHPEGMPSWQRATATLVHWGIYIAVFVQLLSGPMTVATGPGAIPFFNLFSFRLPVAQSEEAHHQWEEVHEFTWKLIAVLLVLHIVGAFYNQFALRNDVLRRMTTGTGRRD